MVKELQGVYLAWAKKFISFNSWRIEGDFEDCLQEAQIKFIQCQKKYGDVEAPHLMSLFQCALVRHFHTLSNKRSKYSDIRKESTFRHNQYLRESLAGTDKVTIELLDLQRNLWSVLTRMEFLVMGIKQELCEATGYSGENPNSLLDAADKMPDEIFIKLSEDAQDWLDKAVIAFNNKKPLPPLPTETKKPKKAKVPTVKVTGGVGKGKVGRTSKFPDTAKIKILIRGNPKRRNSQSHKIFELYKDGMSVEEFLKAGGSRRGLNWDTDRKFIRIIEESLDA